LRAGWAVFDKDGNMELPGAADGEGFVVLAGTNYLGYVNLEKGPQKALFDFSKTGSIVVTAKTSTGAPAENVRLFLMPEPLAKMGRNDLGGFHPPFDRMIVTTDSRGMVRLATIGPGKYRLLTNEDDLNSKTTAGVLVEVKAGEETKVEIAAESTPPYQLPLRDHAQP
jgi:hypothetical protein